MIHLPIIKHIKRLLTSVVVFGSAVILMLWVPIRILRYVFPNFLPYIVAMQTEAQINELSLELLLLQVIPESIHLILYISPPPHAVPRVCGRLTYSLFSYNFSPTRHSTPTKLHLPKQACLTKTSIRLTKQSFTCTSLC